jgi:hypothetical protein
MLEVVLVHLPLDHKPVDLVVEVVLPFLVLNTLVVEVVG